MRRFLATLAVLTVGLGLTSTLSAGASAPPPPASRGELARALVAANPEPQGAAAADAALASAEAILGEERAEGRRKPGGDATLALRALRLSYDELSRSEQEQANRLLARPVRGQKVCGARVCVHYGLSGENATDPDWAGKTMRTMERVWTYEVGTRNYRRPADDRGRGGTAKFDVYLEDLLDNGLYGYCVAEARVPGQQFRYLGYCVLDNDYRDYPLAPGPTLRVTAAHEFFHAIQFNYDAAEDGWVMETTATWMEELFADDVNDNRSYLPESQIAHPGRPLDLSRDPSASPAWYGNWVFFQRFAQRLGPGAVRTVWERLDANTGARDEYSIQGVRNVLWGRGIPLPRFYADFGAGNAFPGRLYDEGASYPRSPMTTETLGGNGVVTGSATLKHLTYRNRSFVPAASLTGDRRLRISVNGPWAASRPGVYASVLFDDGTFRRSLVELDKFGNGVVTTRFSPAVTRVVLTLANAGTEYSCWTGGNVSCRGYSKSNNKRFDYAASVIP